jgi:hypothetical protein
VGGFIRHTYLGYCIKSNAQLTSTDTAAISEHVQLIQAAMAGEHQLVHFVRSKAVYKYFRNGGANGPNMALKFAPLRSAGRASACRLARKLRRDSAAGPDHSR